MFSNSASVWVLKIHFDKNADLHLKQNIKAQSIALG